eukprot:2959218-Pyramimonas_sp.AAC.1
MMQEIGRAPFQVQEAEPRLGKLGWQASLRPSVIAQDGGLSSGVGISCRRSFGMGLPPGASAPRLPSPRRMRICWVNACIPAGFLAVHFTYLRGVRPLGPMGLIF